MMRCDHTRVSAQNVICSACGASTPMLGADVRCLYCLAHVPLPQSIAQHLAEHQTLREQLDAQFASFDQARSGFPGDAALLIIIGLAFTAIVGGSGLFAFIKNDQQIPSAAIPPLVIAGIVYGGFITALLGGGLRSIHLTRKRLANLPFANVQAGAKLAVSCPSCGGGIVAKRHEIATTCGRCGTGCLLPAAMVSRRLQSKHRLVIAMKQSLGDVRQVAGEASVTWYGKTLILAGVVLGLGMITYFVFIAEKPAHLDGAEYWLAAIMPGVMVGGLVAGFGWLNLRN